MIKQEIGLLYFSKDKTRISTFPDGETVFWIDIQYGGSKSMMPQLRIRCISWQSSAEIQTCSQTLRLWVNQRHIIRRISRLWKEHEGALTDIMRMIAEASRAVTIDGNTVTLSRCSLQKRRRMGPFESRLTIPCPALLRFGWREERDWHDYEYSLSTPVTFHDRFLLIHSFCSHVQTTSYMQKNFDK